LLNDAEPEASYVNQLLPIKLALEVVYVRNRSLTADVRIIMRTTFTIIGIAFGKSSFAEPHEIEEARRLLNSASNHGIRTTMASQIPDPEREMNVSGRRY
jgi:hypothetical protein